MTVFGASGSSTLPSGMCRYTSRRTGCRVYLPSPYAACPSLLAQEGMEWADEPMPGAVGGCGGGKRKQSPSVEEEDGGASYMDMRQAVLNMSMVKLRMPAMQQRRTEPSLRRSVLIFNTLKHIETELKDEGVAMHPSYSSPPAQLMAPKPAEVALDPHPEGLEAAASMECSASSTRLPSRTVECVPPTVSEECSGAAATPSLHVCQGAAEAAHMPLLPSPAPTSPPPTSSLNCHSTSSVTILSETRTLLDSVFSASCFPPLLDSPTDNRLTSNPTATPGVSVSNSGALQTVSSMSSYSCSSSLTSYGNGYPSCQGASAQTSLVNYTMDTDWFHDLDLTWLDFDLFTPLTSMVCTNGNSTKLPSLNPEDLSHSLSTCGGNGDNDSLGTLPTPSCNPKNDLLSEDLDRVMEILVGM